MSTAETPEGRRFRETMHSRADRRPWPKQPSNIPVEIREACDSGCCPAGIAMAGKFLFASRAELERCIMLLRSAADQLWGPKP